MSLNIMTHIREKAIEGLNVGDMFSVSRKFTENDMNLFADITRDYNPVHFDERFTEVKGYDSRIYHIAPDMSLDTALFSEITKRRPK